MLNQPKRAQKDIRSPSNSARSSKRDGWSIRVWKRRGIIFRPRGSPYSRQFRAYHQPPTTRATIVTVAIHPKKGISRRRRRATTPRTTADNGRSSRPLNLVSAASPMTTPSKIRRPLDTPRLAQTTSNKAARAKRTVIRLSLLIVPLMKANCGLKALMTAAPRASSFR